MKMILGSGGVLWCVFLYGRCIWRALENEMTEGGKVNREKGGNSHVQSSGLWWV
jgi:hypothetical protein